MARTREIPRDEWQQWLDLLSRLGGEKRIRIEIDSKELGDQEIAKASPFMGIDLDVKGSATGTIEIIAESPGRGSFSHTISDPAHLFVLEHEPAGVDMIDIEEANGDKVLLYFEPPIELAVPAQPFPATPET